MTTKKVAPIPGTKSLASTRHRSLPSRSTYADLSFTRKPNPDSELNLWSVTASGNYARDCHAGSLYGLEALEFLANNPRDMGYLMSGVALAMMRGGGEPSGVEIGFWGTIEKFAVFGTETHDTAQHRAYVRTANAVYEQWLAQIASAP